MVREEVKKRCEEQNLDIGFLLENAPESLTLLDGEDIKIAKNELLSPDCNFQLSSKDSKKIALVHKSNSNAEVVFHDRYIYFSSGFNNSWSIIHASMSVMEMSNYKLRRFDFQNGGWC